MTREIMKEIKELIAQGHSGHEIVAMGYAASTVRKVGDMMALRGELPGVTQTMHMLLNQRGGETDILREIRREFRERGFRQGSIDAIASKLREKSYFDKDKDLRLAEVLALGFVDAFNLVASLIGDVAKENGDLRDKVKVLEQEIGARDRLLKKLMNRFNQPTERASDEPERGNEML